MVSSVVKTFFKNLGVLVYISDHSSEVRMNYYSWMVRWCMVTISLVPRPHPTCISLPGPRLGHHIPTTLASSMQANLATLYKLDKLLAKIDHGNTSFSP